MQPASTAQAEAQVIDEAAPAPLPQDALEDALARGRRHLLSLQDPAGWWKAELQTNVTMDAEDLLLREFLGIGDAQTVERAANWIRSQQREDGSWANFYGAPANLSTTVEAYAALRLAGDPPDAPHMAAARESVLAAGGVENARVFTHIWLALFGLWDWDDVPALPPELIFLPPWFPLNIYDFACWARQTIAALTIVRAERPVRPLPFDLSELRTGRPVKPRPRTFRGRVLLWLDRVGRMYERRPLRPLRRRAMKRVERWVLDRQEDDGSWGGIQPPWVYSLMALSLRGHDVDDGAIKRGLDGIERFLINEGDVRRLEACQSPVWDTALAMIALADAGVEADDPALVKAADWLLDEEVRIKGDWAVRRPKLDPGGWAFEFDNDHYPDIDDTAEVVIALRRVRHPQPERVAGAIRRGTEWTVGMQSRNGGWGAFDADNVREMCRDIPFCDFGEVIDEPSADVTAHVLEMLAGEGPTDAPAAREGISYLLGEQEDGGSWFGRWGVNHVYGTGAALPGLVDCGVPRSDPRLRARSRLARADPEPRRGLGRGRPFLRRRGVDRPRPQHRLADGLGADRAARARRAHARRSSEGWRGWSSSQRSDGTWDEPEYTGTGFPGHFYINYHLYRLSFPVMALGRWAAAGEKS